MTLNTLLRRPGPLLLDFDGPVADVFAGYPASVVADELINIVRARGIKINGIDTPDDPLAVLRWAAATAPAHLTELEDELVRAEQISVRTAPLTPGVVAVVKQANITGNSVAIVSNNSFAAIHEFIERHDMSKEISFIVGRRYACPAEMKPDPTPIMRALRQFNAAAHECVFVGDSDSDITASRAVGMPIIGFANKPHKVHTFTSRADAVVTSMREIADAYGD